MSKAAELANLIGNINAGGGGVNRNVIINGAMNVAQRSTSEASRGDDSGYYTIDRWRIDTGSSTDGRLTMSQDSSAPIGFANSLKFDCTTADTSIAAGEKLVLQTKIEGQNAQIFAKGTSSAKPMALSFYVKGNASATYVAEIFDSNDRQCSKTFNVTTDWTRIKLSFPADTTGTLADDNATGLFVNFHLNGGSNFTSGTLNSSGFASNTNANRAVGISSFFDSTDRTFFLTGCQLEVGQNPTEFEHEPFDTTFTKCERYLGTIDAAGIDTGLTAGWGMTRAANNNFVSFPLATPLRAAPAVSVAGGVPVRFAAEGAQTEGSNDTMVINSVTPSLEFGNNNNLVCLNYAADTGPNTTINSQTIGFMLNAGGRILFDAEL